MNLVDANVLLYATNSSSSRHDTARTWLSEALSGEEATGFTWIVLLAFLRLSTHPAIFPRPLDGGAGCEIVRDWLAQPNAVVVEPATGHMATVTELLAGLGTAGNLVNDAHLAAIALDRKATLFSYDNDFARFPGLDWQIPG
ncbi:MAG TPA: TA system VapC family ribonuclease toxin [Nocardioidaceae bacterium]|nr:TA system VapC family ribonuclease toxin [Nocardioidaceae bacterium]